MLRGFLNCEECALSVDAEQTVEIRLGEIEKGLTDQFNAGVRYDNVETPEFLKGNSKHERARLQHEGQGLARSAIEEPRAHPSTELEWLSFLPLCCGKSNCA